MDTKKKGGKRRSDKSADKSGTPEVSAGLRQRLAALGIDVSRVPPGMAVRLGADPTTGTAIGRLMWVYRRDGQRDRRMMADGKTPVITDEMAAAADFIATAWAAWRRAEGLPSCSALVGQIGGSQRPKKASPVDAPPPPWAIYALRRWSVIYAALKACPQPRLVWAAIEAVVLEDTLDRCFRIDDLRKGLEAVAGVG